MTSPEQTQPGSSSETSGPQWHVTGTCITPSPEFTQSLNAFCATSRSDDPTIRFIFSAPPTSTSETQRQDFVHVSRLRFAGGPLGALIHLDFSERHTRTVHLCPEDDPVTFVIIRNFLYGIQIKLASLPLPHLLRVMRSAHRWELVELFGALCLYISTSDLFCDAPALLNAVDIVALPDLPDGFRDYFWNSAAKFFPELSSPEFEVHSPSHLVTVGASDPDDIHNPHGADRDERQPHAPDDDDKTELELESLPINHRLCPRFPEIWDLALAHGALVKFIDDICKLSVPGLNASLLDLVVRYLEARIPDDDMVFSLLELLGPKSMRHAYLFNRASIDTTCSARAVRLLAKSLIAPTELTPGMSFAWDMALGTIAPCRKNFLYGACVPASRGSRSRWDPNLFDASSAIHVHIESVSKTEPSLVTGMELSEVSFSVRWDVGPCFPLKDMRMEFDLRMMRKRSGEHRAGPELYVISRKLELTQKAGTFREVLGGSMFDTVVVENGDMLTLALDMRLVRV